MAVHLPFCLSGRISQLIEKPKQNSENSLTVSEACVPGAVLGTLQTPSRVILTASREGETIHYPRVTGKELSWAAGWLSRVPFQFWGRQGRALGLVRLIIGALSPILPSFQLHSFLHPFSSVNFPCTGVTQGVFVHLCGNCLPRANQTPGTMGNDAWVLLQKHHFQPKITDRGSHPYLILCSVGCGGGGGVRKGKGAEEDTNISLHFWGRALSHSKAKQRLSCTEAGPRVKERIP